MRSTFEYSIAEINYLTPSHLQLILHPIKKVMPFEAGQYLTILYPNGENMPFSIANAPKSTHEIELHIRISAEDFATQEFINSLHLSKIISLSGPFGECQYRDRTKPLLLLSAGTGFAPAKAIIEHLFAKNITTECRLYWTVKYQRDFYLPDLVRYWENFTHFHFVGIATQDEKTQQKKNILEAITHDIANFAPYQVYVFGPPNLAIETLKRLIPLGLDKNNFFSDVLSKQEIDII